MISKILIYRFFLWKTDCILFASNIIHLTFGRWNWLRSSSFMKYAKNNWKGIQSLLFRVHLTFNYKVTRFHFLQSMLYNCFMRKVKPALCAKFFFNYSLEKIMKKTYHLLATEAKFHIYASSWRSYSYFVLHLIWWWRSSSSSS